MGDTTSGEGLVCSAQEGVRFCPGSTAVRVRTFDGVPLDVNVTLPASGDGPWPLLFQLHGWGGAKGGLSASKQWAERGYAVVNYTARGFGNSCGSAASRQADPAGCAKGWIRLADSRYEVRDSQHLAGLLADEGVADPQRIGAMGGSYGGGQSLQLATLRDRVRLPDGSYDAWLSPDKGLPMRVAAASPSIPWSDLVYSLMPNGRDLDYALPPADYSRKPIGVMKQSYVSGLFAAGVATGYYSPPGADPDADLTTWYAAVQAGDPYDESPLAPGIADEIASNHSPYHLEMDRTPAPLFISNGFTDDLFPVDEAVRYANKALALHPDAQIAQMHFDYGHARGQSKDADMARYRAAIAAFFDKHLKGDASAAAPTGVQLYTQTCPEDAPSGGPITGATWHDTHPGEVRLADAEPQSVVSASGDPTIAQAFDPIAGGGACATTPAEEQPNTAVYNLPVAGSGFTLAGSPTVVTDVAVTGTHASVAARLLDVSPDGEQTLVARALYRPGEGGARQVFQLHSNAYRFEPGHIVKLELLGQDTPYGRAPNTQFEVELSNLELRLPVAERPDGTQVLAPSPQVLPEGYAPAPGTAADDTSAPPGEGAGGGSPAPSGAVLGATETSRCVAGRGRITRAGVRGLRVGATRASLVRAAGEPASTRGRRLRWCVSGGGSVTALLSAKGRAVLIRTTARGHTARGVGAGQRARSIRRPVRIDRGLLVSGRQRRIVFVLRRSRVSSVAVVSRSLARSPRALRAALRASR